MRAWSRALVARLVAPPTELQHTGADLDELLVTSYRSSAHIHSSQRTHRAAPHTREVTGSSPVRSTATPGGVAWSFAFGETSLV